MTSRNQDFARLAAGHSLGVWRYLRLLGCDAATAEDIVQDVFLEALRGSFDYRGEAEAGAWLRLAARNRYFNHRRRPRGVELDALAETADEVWEEYIEPQRDERGTLGEHSRAEPRDASDDLVNALRRCLETLDDRAREAIRLRYGASAARRDVAHTLGLSDAGARTLLQRAKARLRECIERKRL